MIKFWRKHFLTGLLAITPLAFTAWILWRFYLLISNTMRPWLAKMPTLSEAYPELGSYRLRGRLDERRVLPYWDRAAIFLPTEL